MASRLIISYDTHSLLVDINRLRSACVLSFMTNTATDGLKKYCITFASPGKEGRDGMVYVTYPETSSIKFSVRT